MNDKFSLLKLISLISIFLYSNNLKCPPDHFRPLEYYWPNDDYTDNSKNYGFFFNYRIEFMNQKDFVIIIMNFLSKKNLLIVRMKLYLLRILMILS